MSKQVPRNPRFVGDVSARVQPAEAATEDEKEQATEPGFAGGRARAGDTTGLPSFGATPTRGIPRGAIVATLVLAGFVGSYFAVNAILSNLSHPHGEGAARFAASAETQTVGSPLAGATPAPDDVPWYARQSRAVTLPTPTPTPDIAAALARARQIERTGGAPNVDTNAGSATLPAQPQGGAVPIDVVPGVSSPAQGMPAGAGAPAATAQARSIVVPYLADDAEVRNAPTASAPPAPSPVRAADPPPVDSEQMRVTLPHQVQHPLSPYTLQAGSMIPAVLAYNVASEFPGSPRALVSQDVYDSINERHLLVPGGSHLLGHYAHDTVYGQNRIYIVWDRLFFPNGDWLALDGMPGTDQVGQVGLNAGVDKHTGNLVGGALLMSLLQAGVALASPQTNANANQTPTVAQTIGVSLAQQLGQMGLSVTQQALSQVPTLTLSAGERFNVEVVSDLVLHHPYAMPTEVSQ